MALANRIHKFIKNIHNKELPEWMNHRIKENSDLIINYWRAKSNSASYKPDLAGWFRNEEERNKGYKMIDQFEKGDWVRIYSSEEAFQVEWVSDDGMMVGLVGEDPEPVHKVTKLDLNKYKISSYTVNYWSKK